jgi:SAM-dependent methyltransferase
LDAAYDTLGRGYAATRKADPRIAGLLHAAIGDARTVVNVGAGTGNYEPRDRWVLAVEPSSTMIGQRPPDAAPVIRASAERLPLADGTVDAALATLTIHHWADWRAGVGEMLRVARRRVVIWTFDPDALESLWLARDYLPETIAVERARTPAIADLVAALGGDARVEPVPIPRDCRDGVAAAFYARPERYLDPVVRAGMSSFAGLEDAPGLTRLAADLQSGAWDERYGDQRHLPELDAGYRLVVAERRP